ncbi:phospholipase D family protein [Pseudoalteromonas obscura]|uniref:Phospholipase D family protein n=1 Tax=Pseudoalteromonas obscura TaxID=3048491 RepID=A0ABT7EK48_9GAMM|nr:phospholipase D family protein [Pseudoalteromonas sp. P94(2023)]MDK2595409.1 phospholipase D family protein [Pseudoalteromonas sp. P94(2023)]
MSKFLNTTAINYHLEELIKSASERLILISPYLKLNSRIKELLEDKDRMKIDIRVVYGKSELQPEEISWLNNLSFVRTSFCQNLHAKCYLNERSAIITSLNLYEFSQVNNNEMGILIERDQSECVYKDTYEECQRIIRISDEVKMSIEKVATQTEESEEADTQKLTTSKLAKQHKLKTSEFLEKLEDLGYLESSGDGFKLTSKATDIGAEQKYSKRFGSYFIWPESIKI